MNNKTKILAVVLISLMVLMTACSTETDVIDNDNLSDDNGNVVVALKANKSAAKDRQWMLGNQFFKYIPFIKYSFI